MNIVQPVTTKNLKSLTVERVELSNAIYRHAPLTSDEWEFVFEPQPSGSDSNQSIKTSAAIELVVTNGKTESSVLLELLSDLADSAWQQYAAEVQLLAWSVSHETLLDRLDQALLGSIHVAKIFDYADSQDKTRESEFKNDAYPIEFTLYHSQEGAHCRGRLWGCEALVSERALTTETAPVDAWLDLPGRIPITLSAIEITHADLHALEPGGLIRLDSTREELMGQLSLAMGPYRFIASTLNSDTNSSLQISLPA